MDSWEYTFWMAMKASSEAWSKAYMFFVMHEEAFKRIYHKRSNVESTFAAIKRKFGESVKSKKHQSQVNELLCKVIAYNITVLIKAMFEHDIDLNFGLTLIDKVDPNPRQHVLF